VRNRRIAGRIAPKVAVRPRGDGAPRRREDGELAASPLCVRLLGEIELWRGAQRLALPPSRKTRALLAYLVVTERPQRRDRLCNLLWDVADDPRAALRWSLSKLRALLDEPGVPRIVVDGSSVAFREAGARVDLFTARTQIADLEALATEQLVQLAAEFRGEFLEGLELRDFHEFQFWCVAIREEARVLRARVLNALVERLAGEPAAALPYARTLVQVDPFNADACIALIELLAACGRRREAEQQFEACSRLLRELPSPDAERLAQAWRDLSQASEPSAPAARTPPPASVTMPPPGAALIGRHQEWQALQVALDNVTRQRRLRCVILAGEPGIGKTRLLEELIAEVQRRGGSRLDGRAYEAEMSRPYGPWIDALRRMPAVSIGDTLGADLSPLLPEWRRTPRVQASRDRLFGAVVELIAARAHSAAPVLLVLDDAHWCDDASAELLHYVARMSRNRAVLVALSVREGELPDNQPMLRVLRSLRRDGLLQDITVAPLSAAETAELVRQALPGVDAPNIPPDSAGNPRFALELARALVQGAERVPATLRQLVRDRIDRLPADAAEVLRWGAVVGQTFAVARLSELTPLDIDRLVPALAVLERHALLRVASDDAEAGAAYSFAHEVVRQVVYAELSEPRRRLMHLRIAKALQASHMRDEMVAADLAHHAALAGDAETAARACLEAARRCLRVFASTEANATARRGMYHAQQLAEPERVKLLIELAEIRYAAHRPRHPDEASRTVEELAQHALDLGCVQHARLGFHLASYIRWEGGEWSDAQRHMMRAEQIGRLSDERERVVALAEAARCLTLLEHDLGHADALLLEAGALSSRLAFEPAAIPDAVGMLRLHEGRLPEAAEQFQRARQLCRKEQDRLGEFRALEHLAMVELQRGQHAAARAISGELVDIAARLREGSETPFAHAMSVLCRYVDGDDTGAELDVACAELRAADAKQRLAYVLMRAAECDLRHGQAADARRRADEALQLARRLERPSDVVLARVLLARAAALQQDADAGRGHLQQLTPETLRGVSAQARLAAEQLYVSVADGPPPQPVVRRSVRRKEA
jgi:DNA-binding SARP family transcriptional activator/tetratricopeptide (TPR) repeat protein